MLSVPMQAQDMMASDKKGGCYDMDDLCDTLDTMGVGIGKQLHDGRIHSYFTRCGSRCSGIRPLSEVIHI